MKTRWVLVFVTVVAVTVLLMSWTQGTPPVVAQGPRRFTPVISQPVSAVVSPALRDIPPVVSVPGATPRLVHLGQLPNRAAASKAPVSLGLDPVAQTRPGNAPMPATIQNFEGIGMNDYLPSDANGDIGYDPATGKKYYFQMVNVELEIWDVTSTPTPVVGPVAIHTLWSTAPLGDLCRSQDSGDPIVLFDTLAKRWLVSQFEWPNVTSTQFQGPFYQCIAISQTSDPTGAYNIYDYPVDPVTGNKANDYPKFGVWPDGYYMSVNQFISGSGNFVGAGAYVFDRANMLLGNPASFQYVDTCPTNTGCTLGGMLPTHLGGTTPPPGGNPNYFVQFDDGVPDQLEVWGFHVDWGTPSNSTFTNLLNLTTASFSSVCPPNTPCIQQQATSQQLDALDDRMMYRLQYRNFGGYDSLVVNHTVWAGDVANHAGVRWYELRRSGGPWSIRQQGTYAPDASSRWMGSIAMDGQGDLALGYSVSSGSVYPSIRYAGRLAGDPLGTLPQTEATLQAGSGSQTYTNRWGDYTSMSVDPVDDCTFWYTNQYYMAPNYGYNWHTRIGSFRFAGAAVLRFASAAVPSVPGPYVYYFPLNAKSGSVTCN
ncbi:MAG: hypothetical protein KGJ80_07310 [Chloroflexota bacterium]|nr:hypothetical protein [Chloroflexota bacterium]